MQSENAEPDPAPATIASTAPAAQPVRRWRRVRKWLWRRTKLMVVVLTVLYLTRALWLGPVVAHVASHWLAGELQAPVSIDAVEGSYIGGLTLRGVRIGNATQRTKIASVICGRLDCNWDLTKLLTGHADWITAVDVVEASVVLDDRGGRPAVRVPTLPGADGLPKELPVRLPAITVHHLDFRFIIDDQRWLQVRGLDLTAASNDRGAVGINLDATSFEARLQDAHFAPRRLRVSGEVTANEIRASIGFADDTRIAHMQGADEFTARLGDTPDTLEISGPARFFGGRLLVHAFALHISGPNERFTAVATLDNLDLAPLADIFGRDFPISAGLVSGEVSASVDTSRPHSLDGRAVLRVSDAVLADAPVDMVDLDLTSVDGHVSGTVHATAPFTTLDVVGLDVDLRDPATATGSVALEIEDVGKLAQQITPRLLDLFGPTVTRTLIALDTNRYSGVSVKAAASINAAREVTATVHATEPGGTVVDVALLHGVFDLADPLASPVGATLTVHAPDLKRLAAYIPGTSNLAPVGSADLTLRVDGTLESASLELTLDADGVGTTDHLRAEIRASRDHDRLLVTRCRLDAGVDRVDAALVATIGEKPTVERLLFDADIRDLSRYAALVGIAPADLSGSLLACTSGRLSGIGAPGERFGVTLPSSSLILELSRVRAAGFDIATARLDCVVRAGDVQINALDLRTGHGSVGLAGRVDFSDAPRLVVELSRLDAGHRTRMLSLDHPTRIAIDLSSQVDFESFGGLPKIGIDPPVELSGPHGSLRIAGTSDAMDLTAVLHNLAPAFAEYGVDLPAPEHLSVTARLRNAGFHVELAATALALPDLPPLSVHVDATLSGGVLAINSGTVSYEGDGRALVDLTARLPIDPFATGDDQLTVSASLHARDLAELASLLPGELRPQGALDALLTVSGSWEAPVVVASLNARRIELRGLTPELAASAGIRLQPQQVGMLANLRSFELDVQLGYSARQLTIEHAAFRLADANVDVTVSGSVELRADPREWLRKGGPSPGKSKLAVDATIGDLSKLPLPASDMRWLTGAITCTATFGDDGKWLEPSLMANVVLTGVGCRYEGLPTLEALNAELVVSGRDLRIGRFKADLGGGPMTLSGGASLLPGNNALKLDLNLKGTNLLLARSIGVRIRGDADVRVVGRMPLQSGIRSGVRLSGRVDLGDCRVASLVDYAHLGGGQSPGVPTRELIIFQLTDQPLASVVLDGLKVRFRAGSSLELSTNVVKGRVVLDLVLNGTLAVPEPQGLVSMLRGTITLPTTSLELQTAQLRFESARPFDPGVIVVGRTRMRGYDINVSYEGRYTRLGDLDVNLSSQPPLSSDDLSLLLLTGKPPDQAIGSKSSLNSAATFAVYFGKDVIDRLFSSDDSLDDEGESLFDKVEIEIGKSLSRTGAETIEVRYRLLKNLLGDNDRVLLTGERDVYDEYNGGVAFRVRFR